MGSIILIVAWVTKDAFYPIPHLGTGLVLGGILSVYVGYRKLAKELIESENHLLRY
ncbi:MAG: hypothetical protein HXS44_12790 [Theionarchaea archaeon]|nr:hypothetical protein [Theionarchaea archaeon]